MKRYPIQIADIATFDNLLLATWKAARGKRQRPDVVDFLININESLYTLHENIMQEKVPCGIYNSFYINDPKRRLIHAACFAERVLHHAIMNQAEWVFERLLIADTYACRLNKGVHKAVSQVQKNMQRFCWFVKVDVKSYFPSINHQVLVELLCKRFKGDDFLRLLQRIIDSYHATPDKGLPIGSLTSQHFANFYLNGADRFLQQHPLVNAQVRYMDDTIWWCHDKASAKQVLTELQDYLTTYLELQLKSTIQINRSHRGVSYCGYRILPGTIRLSPRKKKRYQQLRKQCEYAWQNGTISTLQLQSAYDSVHAITLHADSITWRKRNLQLHPSSFI
ncbi:MAG: reverse transcriptase domain-containing protein [Methylococcaceae bacterium]